ncbi:unnamed protein product [Vitrella brassicaformis CCMP3155]|uniref:Uncharacterized protein n=1 Tax=Vitrella brassicaformis (strain CCMP3155) TaxID=1169540 RepID=A0A0G4EV03_VITBC|nr:unnamed protein product [Vitrella brassicaformis CCMP3155]|eukprot:CEM02431.1 unnamed protein product [Vitrella brassicaformis CCMP3155]
MEKLVKSSHPSSLAAVFPWDGIGETRRVAYHGKWRLPRFGAAAIHRRPCVDRDLLYADKALAAIEQSAKQMRKKLRQQAKTIKDLITSNGGQPVVTGSLSEEIEVNVGGGTVLCVPRKPLLLPGVSDSFVAYLLLHHLDGLPKDTEGRPFLDADPIYIDWLFDEIANVGAADAQGETKEIVFEPGPDDPFYHDLFFDNKISSQQQQQKDASAHDLGEKKDAAGGAKKAAAVDDPLSDLHTNVKNLETAVDRLWSAELELTKFHAVMGPFLKSGGGGADEIKSVRVMGKRVSTTEATLAFIGRDKPLGTAFDRCEEHTHAARHKTLPFSLFPVGV